MIQPEERAAQQEAADLVPAVIEDEAFPVGMITLLRVGVLEEMRAVEITQAVLVVGKMRRHPVEDDANPLLVQIIDQVHQILGRAVPARRREVTGRLIPPGAEKRMLSQGQKLDVGEAHFSNVSRQWLGQLAIIQGTIFLFRHAPPGAEMDFINGDRRG